MKELKGSTVVAGLALGHIVFLTEESREEAKTAISDPAAEAARFEEAADIAAQELETVAEESKSSLGEENAQIFEIHALMARDEDFRAAVRSVIADEKVSAEYAVRQGVIAISRFLTQSGDDYIGERTADLGDVADRIIARLKGKTRRQDQLPDDCILAATELNPSQVARLDMGKVRAILTQAGSSTSHAAILARSLGIPSIMRLGSALSPEFSGHCAIVDAGNAVVVADPSSEILAKYQEMIREADEKKKRLVSLVGQKNETRDGRTIELHANIGRPGDLPLALANDAGGIGLFRSEFLFLERQSAPSEEEQYIAYRSVLEGMGGRRVVVRSLDIGADKQVDYLDTAKEANPALGLRAIRLCFSRPELFRTQLRALLRASLHGRLGIMFPMITSVGEIRRIKLEVGKVQAELDREGIAWNPAIEIGVMVETPAAAIMSDELAGEVDFFSIGTNDLTQYTLAADRENPAVASYYDPKNPAILRLIELTVRNAHALGAWVGICGELAAEPSMAETFLKLGVDELSVAAPSILPLREKIRDLDLGSRS